jgi:esterase FrsA
VPNFERIPETPCFADAFRLAPALAIGLSCLVLAACGNDSDSDASQASLVDIIQVERKASSSVQDDIPLPVGSYPESIARAADGTLFISAQKLGKIFRVRPGSKAPEVFVDRLLVNETMDLVGLALDAPRNRLYACSASNIGGFPEGYAPALKAFDATTGVLLTSFPTPNGGSCNDMAVDASGNVYVTDNLSVPSRILKLASGASALTVWSTSLEYANPQAVPAVHLNGIAIDKVGDVFAVSTSVGGLFRIPVLPNGSASAPVRIQLSRPLRNPDALRITANQRLLVAEFGTLQNAGLDGGVSEVLLSGNTGTVRPLALNIDSATSFVTADDDMWIVESRLGDFFGRPAAARPPAVRYASLANLTPIVAAPAANSMAQFCEGGAKAYPGGLLQAPPVWKFNICWWLEDAQMLPTEFDAAVLPATELWGQPTYSSALRTALDAAGKSANERALAAREAGDARRARREYLRASVYFRLNRVPRNPASTVADRQAIESAYQLGEEPLERINLQQPSGSFVGYFGKPAAGNERLPVIVMMAGLDNFKSEMLRQARLLRENGFATLILDNPQTGENSLPFVPESRTMLQTAANYLKTRTDVDATRMVTYGWSMGGFLAIAGALDSPDYKAAVNVGGPTNSSFVRSFCEGVPSFIGNAYTFFADLNPATTPRSVTCEYYDRFQLRRIFPQPTAEQLVKPLLFVNGSEEDLAARDEPQSVANLGYRVSRLTYAGDGHTAEGNLDKHVRLAGAWLSRVLNR